MRSSKSRSRNKNRNNRPSGGNIINRVFDSSGPDGKVRGTPQQIVEKYNQLHRDGVLSGDRVDAENFAQHAEHYTRLLAEAQREVESKREEQEAQNRERQAERDRERQERIKAQEAAGNQPSPPPQPPREQAAREQPSREQPVQEHPEPAPVDAEQPRLDVAAEEEGSGLVETPEEKPKRPRRPRAPRKPRDTPDGSSAPEAAE